MSARHRYRHDLREHGGEKFGEKATLPYVSKFERVDGLAFDPLWRWDVIDHNGLVIGGACWTRRGAVRQIRRHLRREYIAFAEQIARVEELEFNE